MNTAARPVQLGADLSDRELQCLAGAAAGLTDVQIGRALYLAEDTVKGHMRRVYGKLGARNRANAVWLATARGILTRRHVHAASPAAPLERAS